MPLTIAKELDNKVEGSKNIIIHFYGDDSYSWGNEFRSEIDKFRKSELSFHPYDYLAQNGFIPLFERTWAKFDDASLQDFHQKFTEITKNLKSCSTQ